MLLTESVRFLTRNLVTENSKGRFQKFMLGKLVDFSVK